MRRRDRKGWGEEERSGEIERGEIRREWTGRAVVEVRGMG